jgi:hypothetical protein
VKERAAALLVNVGHLDPANISCCNFLLVSADLVDVIYLSMDIATETSTGIAPSPRDMLQPYLSRLATESAFEAYYLSHRGLGRPLKKTTTSETSSEKATEDDTPDSANPVVLLRPYSDREQLTEGLDYEAGEGERAFWSVMGGRSGQEAPEAKGFFDKDEEDEEGNDDNE